MAKFVGILASCAGVANAQFAPNMGTLDAVADNNVEEAQAFANAAGKLPSASSQTAAIDSMNANEQAALTGNSSGCVVDYSTGECVKSGFLAKKRGTFDALVRPLIQRTLDTTPDVGDNERKTQAPLVWIKLHKATNVASSGEQYSDFVGGKSFLHAPAFPGNSASNAAAINSAIRSATSSGAYAKKTANSGSVVARAKAALGANAAADGKAAQRLQDMKASAFNLVHANVVKALHNGGCARDYSATCPLGWSSESGSCVPPAGYSGNCGTGAAGSSTQQKEQFAAQCAASWACADAGVNFGSCPAGWTASNGTCNAPASYTGICSGNMDFSAMSDAQKANWAAFCGAHW
jgi:CPW-WPC domain-containing protein